MDSSGKCCIECHILLFLWKQRANLSPGLSLFSHEKVVKLQKISLVILNSQNDEMTIFHGNVGMGEIPTCLQLSSSVLTLVARSLSCSSGSRLRPVIFLSRLRASTSKFRQYLDTDLRPWSVRVDMKLPLKSICSKLLPILHMI